MADLEALKAAPRATVVEPAPSLNAMPMWALFHYRYGQGNGRSIARGDQLAEWLDDLRGKGYLIGYGWELRDQPAPEGWPAAQVEATPEALLAYIAEHHPDVKGLVASQSGPLDDQIAELVAQGWTVEQVEHVAGKRLRIMRPPAGQDGGRSDG